MAAGKFNMQANDGSVIGLIVPDGLTSGERQISLGVNLSGITAYHLLQGNLAVSNSTITQGFSTTLYTGNGSTQAVNTGIDMATQWGDDASEQFGGLVWTKNRTTAYGHKIFDTIRGATIGIDTASTVGNATFATGLTSFNNNGFTTGALLDTNSGNIASWNFQTTHRRTGVTNHGKAYTEHYNPFTGFTIVKYEGSGIAGHEIPHMLGRKLGFVTVKNLSAVNSWVVYNSASGASKGLYLETTSALFDAIAGYNFFNSTEPTDSVFTTGAIANTNASTNQYIMYGWANSYLDESNKLIGNYELVPYQGTGVAGNKVTTRGKPAWVMIKRLDSTGNWAVFDNMRNLFDSGLLANSSGTDTVVDYVNIVDDGIIVQTVNADTNASGGQYIALVAYDTNSNCGGSYYPLASDTANVQINNALIPLAQGIDSNGAKNTILSKNETITGLTYTQGKNYVYCDKNGSYGVTSHKPRYLESELVRTYASEAPEYFDVVSNKWFNTSWQGELVTNGTFSSGVTTGWTNSNSHTQIVENGNLKVTSISTAMGQSYQSISTIVGKQYKVSFFVSNISMSSYGLYIDDVIVKNTSGAFSGLVEYVFIANSVSTKIGLITNPSASGQVIYFDNVTMFATDIVPTTEITNSRNYLNHIVHADNDGGVLYVEELPRIEYKDIVKANEYQGENACTAWIAFDCTTTPPTIKDSYDVSSVIRTATGISELYFENEMENLNYVVNANHIINGSIMLPTAYIKHLNKLVVHTFASNSALYNANTIDVQIFGGKN